MKTHTGIELKIVPVSQVALRNLLFGNSALRKAAAKTLNDPEQTDIAQFSQDELLTLGTEGVRLYNYICAYGVADTAPPEAVAELSAMGYDVSNPRTARMYWLQLLVLDEEDSKELLSEVIKATTGA